MAPANEQSSKILAKVPNHKLRDRGADALKRLGLSPEKIKTLPPLNKILKESRGGISAAIEAMRFSDGELSKTFLEKWDDIPERDRESLTIEMIACACEIEPRHLLGEIMLALRDYSVSRVKILAVSAHPEVMEKRIEFAKLPGGSRDRDALDTMLGALPKKSATFIDKFFAAGPNEDEEEDDPEPKGQTEELVSDEGFVFPDSEVMQEKLQPLRQKLLEAKR